MTSSNEQLVPVEQIGMSAEEALDLISDAISYESWFEGKTLTIMVPDEEGVTKFIKLRLSSITDRPSAADLRGEPS